MPPHAPPAAPPSDAQVQSQIVNFLWAIAELLRDAFKKSENQKVILPFTVLRRLDYALEPAKKKVLELNAKLTAKGLENRHDALCRASGYAFYNTSPLNYDAILDDPAHLKRNLQHYIAGFSENIQEIFHRFKFDDVLRDLEQVGRLYAVMEKFNEKSKINLRSRSEDNPGGLTNHQMGMVFEQLIRRFNEAINENPGEHFTPRDVIHLLVALVILLDDLLAVTKGIRRTVADCAAGTGGMVSIAREEIQARNPTAKVSLFGQELNPQTWAVCRSELLLLDPAGRDADNIALGSTLSLDAHPTRRFDYQFANPPYGTEWKIDRDAVMKEAERGFYGRFGAGLPRISDGQLLFLQHMLFHMNTDTPSYIGIVFNGSPLFTGEAGGGESEIRRWILENGWLHAIVGLPEQLFYNTGIQTYLWILSNRKSAKVRLLDVSGESFWTQMPKSLGNKRREIKAGQRDSILQLFLAAQDGPHCKILDRTEFGYRRIQVERPLRLNFRVTEERLARLPGQSGFASLALSKKLDKKTRAAEEEAGRKLQARIFAALQTLPDELVKDRAVFAERLDAALAKAELKLKEPVRKAILAALGERDETAAPCIAEQVALEPGQALTETDRFHGAFPPPSPPRGEVASRTAYGPNPDRRSSEALALRDSAGPSIVQRLPLAPGQALIKTSRRDGALPGGEAQRQDASFIIHNSPFILRFEPDPELRDYENVPLRENVDDYFRREVLPHVPDAWINPEFRDEKDQEIGKVGYEINFNRYFYQYQPPRPLAAIDAEIRQVEQDTLSLLKEVMG